MNAFFFPDPLSAWAFAALRAGEGIFREEEAEVLLPEQAGALPLWAIPAFYVFPPGEEAWVWVPGRDEGPVPLRPGTVRTTAAQAAARLLRALEEEEGGEIRVPPALRGMLPGFPEAEASPRAEAAAALGAAVRAEGEAGWVLASLLLREEALRRPALAALLAALGRPLRPVRCPAPRPLAGHPLALLLERGGQREVLGAFRSLGRAPEGLERHLGALRAALRRRLGLPLEGEWKDLAAPGSAPLRAAGDLLAPEDLRAAVPEAGFPPSLRRAIAETLGLAGRLPPGIARETLGPAAAWAERAWRIRRGDRSALQGLEELPGWTGKALRALARRVFPDLGRPDRPASPRPRVAPRQAPSREALLALAAADPADRPPEAVRAARLLRPDPEGDPYLALALGLLAQDPGVLRDLAERLPEERPPPSGWEAEVVAAAVAVLAADPAGQLLAQRLLEGAPAAWPRLARRPTLPPSLGPLLRRAGRPWTWEKAAPLLGRLPELAEGRALLEELGRDPVPESLAPAAAWAGLAAGASGLLGRLPRKMGEEARRTAWLPWRPWRFHPDARPALSAVAAAARGWRLASLMLAIAGWSGQADLAREALREVRAGPWEGLGHLREALPGDLPAWLRARLAGEVRRLLEWGGGEEPRALLALAEALGLLEETRSFRDRWPFCEAD